MKKTFAPILALTAALSLPAIATAQNTCDPNNLVTKINGYALPGKVEGLHDVTVMYNAASRPGYHLRVSQGTRKAGTRVGIHVHNFGGHTCVLSGAITIFMEGSPPQLAPAGTCYYMPKDTHMAASNLGTEDAVLIDTFELPNDDFEFITIVEDCNK